MNTDINRCYSCPANSLCKVEGKATSCISDAFYLKGDRTECIICSIPSENALYCTGITIQNKPNKITQCRSETEHYRYYKTAYGCVPANITNNCLTASNNGSKCLSCISGYIMD